MTLHISENRIQQEAQKHIQLCRPGDWSHAKRVVRWIQELGEDRKDLFLIVIAGYIHDIGWRGLMTKDTITLDELRKFENVANKNSESFTTSFLKEHNFSGEHIATINRLIRAADKHQSSQADEEIIVDADNLSKLTIDHLKEKFAKTDWMKMYDVWMSKFPERIKTEKAKLLYQGLLLKLKGSIEQELSLGASLS